MQVDVIWEPFRINPLSPSLIISPSKLSNLYLPSGKTEKNADRKPLRGKSNIRKTKTHVKEVRPFATDERELRGKRV